jgi:hypothetical protein
MRNSKMNKAIFWVAALCAPLSTSAQAVTGFTVVNADTGAAISNLTSSGAVSITATSRINVRANTCNAKSVVFTDARATSTESATPYAYKGDKAGRDFSMALANSQATLVGSASDVGGTLVSTAWMQVSGPNHALLSSADSTTLTALGLVVGTCTFRRKAKDKQGPVAFDEAQVNVTPQGADQRQAFKLAYGATPAAKPLTGFMPYAGAYSVARSVEWFCLQLKDLQTGFNRFNWSALETVLTKIAARGPPRLGSGRPDAAGARGQPDSGRACVEVCQPDAGPATQWLAHAGGPHRQSLNAAFYSTQLNRR